MIDKIAHLQPEIVLFIATCIVMVLGLSRSLGVASAVRPGECAGLGRRGRFSRSARSICWATPAIP
jgi:hypothetical protein